MLQVCLNFLNTYHNAFTSIGIILTFLISLVTLFFTKSNSKYVHYVNTVIKNRIDVLDKLQELVSQYVAKVKVNLYSAVNEFTSTSYLEKILSLSEEIKLMLSMDNNTIIKQIDTINQKFDILINSFHCIDTCGEDLFSHRLNEDVCTNPFFIKHILYCAKEKGLTIKETSQYVGNIDEVVDLFTELNQTPEDVEMFLHDLMGCPENMVLEINNTIDALMKNVSEYCKSVRKEIEFEVSGKKF